MIVLLNSDWLNVEANNATHQLFKAKEDLGIDFYSVFDFDGTLHGTPLDDGALKAQIKASKTKTHHMSDAIRLAALYKIGYHTFTLHFKKQTNS